MLFDFKVDLNSCIPYVNRSGDMYPSPLLTEIALSAMSKVVGEKNLDNALLIYKESPAEQILIAVIIAMMMQNKNDGLAKNKIEKNTVGLCIPETPHIHGGVFSENHHHGTPPPHHHHGTPPPPPPHHHHGAPPPPPHHHHRGTTLPPHVRDNIVKVIYNNEIKEKLKQTYGGKLDYVLKIIDFAPAEIKLTLAMLLNFKVDLSNCTDYINNVVKFHSPILNEVATAAIGEILGDTNTENALFIYNASPPEQVLVAATIAMMIKKRKIGEF